MMKTIKYLKMNWGVLKGTIKNYNFDLRLIILHKKSDIYTRKNH